MQKRYHRVPRFLLKRFSEDRAHLGYVDIKEERLAKWTIKELAQSRDFYSREGECELHKIESPIGWILSEYDKKASFSMGDFNNLALYVITQYMRTLKLFRTYAKKNGIAPHPHIGGLYGETNAPGLLPVFA